MDQLTLPIVLVCLTILGSAIIVSEALSRLTAAVALIGTEIAETARAIRDHINSDEPEIDVDALNALTDKLEAGATQLNDLQSGLAPAEPGVIDVPTEPSAPLEPGQSLEEFPAADEPVALPPETPLQETDGVGAPETIEEANAPAGDGADDESHQG